MLSIVEGVPGSGKSYYAVNYIAENIANHDEFHDHYFKKDNTYLCCNIDGLKLDHTSLDQLLKDHSIQQIFSEENFKKLSKKYNRVIFVIDEVQKYITSQDVWKSISYAFQYHRHYGIEIILITQDSYILPRGLRALAEFYILAYSRSIRMGMYFKYDFVDPLTKKVLYSKTLKRNKKIFNIYKSFIVDEKTKPKSALTQHIALALLFVCLAIGGLFYLKNKLLPNFTKSKTAEIEEPIKKKKYIAPPKKGKPTYPKPYKPVSKPAPGTAQEPSEYIYKVSGKYNNSFLFPDGISVSDPSCIFQNFRIICTNKLNDRDSFLIQNLNKEVRPYVYRN